MLLGMGAKLLVDLFDQTDLIYDASDYAQVVDVLDFYAWSLPRFIHGSIKYLSIYSYLRNAGLKEFWTDYRKTFDEMKSEFLNVFADDSRHAALEWTTKGTEDGDTISYDGVSILEIEGDKVKRFMAYFDSRTPTKQVVD